jgi:hypothetical protein
MNSNLHTIQTAKFLNEPVFVNRDGTLTPYIPFRVTEHRQAYGASLHLIFNHVADFHRSMLEILSEKYNIPVNDMIDVVSKDPRFVDMVVQPVIQTMGYFDKEDGEKVIPPSSQPPVQPSTVDESMEMLSSSVATMQLEQPKKRKILKKVASTK